MSKYQKYLKILELEGEINLKILNEKYQYLKDIWNPEKFNEQNLKTRAINRLKEIEDAYNYLLNDLEEPTKTDKQKNKDIKEENNNQQTSSNDEYDNFKVETVKKVSLTKYSYRIPLRLLCLSIIIATMYYLTIKYSLIDNAINQYNKDKVTFGTPTPKIDKDGKILNEPKYGNNGMPKSLLSKGVSIICYEWANLGDDSKCTKKQLNTIETFFENNTDINWTKEHFEY